MHYISSRDTDHVSAMNGRESSPRRGTGSHFSDEEAEVQRGGNFPGTTCAAADTSKCSLVPLFFYNQYLPVHPRLSNG